MFEKFIHRPVLAIVLSVIVVFLGLLSMQARPVSQFPEIAPPRVIVTIAYPGASADVLVKSTLIPLERSINGVQGAKYVISDATSAGEATIQVIFELGTDPNRAVVNVKNRVDQVLNRLPPLVQLEGVVVSPVQPSMLMYVNLYSTNEEADEEFLYNYANINILAELQRIKGIGSAQILGSRQYAMRIWLKPDRMRAYNISAEEVMEAIDEQSVIGRPGRLGQASGKTAQALEYVLIYQGRYNMPEQYEDIIIRANPDGEILRLKDIAEVELGSEFFDIYSNLDGHPSAAIVLKQTFGSNASEVIEEVKAKLEELEDGFPPGMDYKISYDVSSFLDASIEQVIHTLGEAFVLVALVVFVFLGDWRSTLIPTLAVPVSLIGAGGIPWTLPRLDTPAAWLILLGVLINAGAPPFGSWLPDAYPEGSPSGTVFLSAFTTKTSVYVLIVLFAGCHLLVWVGALMAVYGIVYAILENDMRRILAYSIVNQVGFMVCAVGIGTGLSVNGATAHAFAHIIYKALLLMSAGSVLYMTNKRKCTDLGGLYKAMPVTMWCGIIGALAISAMPITSGFTTKSMILSAAGYEGLSLTYLALLFASAGV
ncbi:MAG: efflux RND transporter permease subunit, partial [Myxococcales bacterium]|nr:efflux RND transporter permease subunit [Myxococcales bacterium]